MTEHIPDGDPSAVAEVVLDVPLRRLRQAIASTLPHAEPTKTGEEPSDLARLRLSARDGELLVAATNSDTSALAAVPIVNDSRKVRFEHHDGPFDVDVPLGPWRPFLAGFKVGKPNAAAEDPLVQITLRPAAVSLVDLSALLPGYAVSIPTLPRAERFPDVVAALKHAAVNAAGDPKPLVTGHAALGLFLPAAKAYKAPLQVEPTGTAGSRGFLVTCTDLFVGSISSRHEDDDSLARRTQARDRILVRLGVLDPAPALL